MHILIKWFYWFKNFGDELILLSLLARIEDFYQPEKISILCGDPQWLEQRILKHKDFLPPIFSKLCFVAKPNRIQQIKMFFWFYSESYDLIIFGGWEVLDEDRKFPYNWRNIPLLYRKYIRQKKFILLWGFWTRKKWGSEYLHHKLFNQAQFIGARDVNSFKQAQFFVPDYEKNKVQLFWDFSLFFLEETKNLFEQTPFENNRGDYILINYWDNCHSKESLDQIKHFLEQHKNTLSIYVPMNIEEENKYFPLLQEHIPSLEKFDRSVAGVASTLKLFFFSQWGIGTKLHFLYPLKYFWKSIEVLDLRYKIQTNFSDLEHLDKIRQEYQTEPLWEKDTNLHHHKQNHTHH